MKKYDIMLTPNFSLSEFVYSKTARRLKIKEQYYLPFQVVENIENLCVNVLQPLRNKVGRIDISSGYRCDRLNKALKGSINSQHMTGCAADFFCRDFNFAIDCLKLMEFDQLIVYQSFLHISYEPKRLRKQIIYK